MAIKARSKIYTHLWYAKEAEEAARFYASIFDRFGLRWQIVPTVLNEMMREKDPARSKRVTDAMLKMVKLDIAALEKAYRS
jgi:predicted 3-demethylubiquinone-9 3-methyltransferase (glyoxalase superfamily)